MNMKTAKLINGICLLLLAGAALVGAATTATIMISGTVPPRAAIEFETGSLASKDLSTLGVANLSHGTSGYIELAKLTEWSNTSNGYTMAITSAHADGAGNYQLKGGASGEYIPYQLKHDTDAFVQNSTTKSYAKTSGTGRVTTLMVNINAGNYSADTYTDTVILTVSAH